MKKQAKKTLKTQLFLCLWLAWWVAAWFAKTGAQGVSLFGDNPYLVTVKKTILLADDWFNVQFWSLF